MKSACKIVKRVDVFITLCVPFILQQVHVLLSGIKLEGNCSKNNFSIEN